MNTKNSKQVYLTSQISLEAVLVTSMKSVKSTMSFYPALKQVSDGSRLKYIVSGEDVKDRFYVLELKIDGITLILNSTSSPTPFLRESISRLISISKALGDDYKINFSRLLPYILTAIAGSDIPSARDSYPSFNRESDILLSKRIIDLLGQNWKLSHQAEELNSRLVAVISQLILLKYKDGVDVERVAVDLGTEKSMVIKSIEALKNSGYSIPDSNGKVFGMVKL